MLSWRAAAIAIAIAAAAVASADDAPVVQVRAGVLEPARLTVHVGEVVRWQGPRGQRLRLDLDRHPEAHEVIEREGEIAAVFLRPGEHSYTATVGGGSQTIRGSVVVREARSPWERAIDCVPGSSDRVCFTR